jgi:tRNA (guanine-N1)-methyltransferase
MTYTARVLTLFPEAFPSVLGVGLTGRALAGGLWTLDVLDIRGFATDRHRTVDDTPAGGGPGMVMYIERFNRTFREEVLDLNLFARLEDVREAAW